MKKLITRTNIYGVVLSAVVLSGCSQEEVVSIRQEGICYSVFAMNQTRAADSYCNNNLPPSFNVWAQIPGGNLYIDNDEIKRNDAGVWVDVNGTRYWPEGKTLNFFAHVNGGDNFKFNDGNPTFDNFVVNGDVSDQLDLMYAVNKGENGDGVGNNGAPVSLNFRHALSQVCFKAKNSTKNLDITIKSVAVGHLTDGGTYSFPAGNTDKNIVDGGHDNINEGLQNGNRGVWTLNTTYDKVYTTYTDVPGGVLMETSETPETVNLTVPTVGHQSGWKNVLTLMPQTVAAWNPENKGTDYNGAYFLIDVDMVDDESDVTIHSGQLALPVSIDWKEGYRYIYTFIFGEGTNGGYNPDPENPKPILSAISYTLTVDDFIPVVGDGTDTEAYKNMALLKMYSNYPSGENNVKTVTVKSNNASHTLKLNSDLTPEAPEGYYFNGWSSTKNGDKTYDEGGDYIIDFNRDTYDLYARWERGCQLTYDSNGIDIVSMKDQLFPISQNTVQPGTLLQISPIVPQVILNSVSQGGGNLGDADSDIRDDEMGGELGTRMIIQHNMSALNPNSGVDVTFVGWSTDPQAKVEYDDSEVDKNGYKVAKYRISEDYEAYYPSSSIGANGITIDKNTRLYAIWSATAQVIYMGGLKLKENITPSTRMTAQHNLSALGYNNKYKTSVKKCVFTYPVSTTISIDDIESDDDLELVAISPAPQPILEVNEEYSGPSINEVTFNVDYHDPETFTKKVYPVCRKKTYEFKITWVDGESQTSETITKNTRQNNYVLSKIPTERQGFVFKGWSTEKDQLNKRIEFYPFDYSKENKRDAIVFACREEGTPKILSVRYEDGLDDETVFEDMMFENLTEGTATPVYKGTPIRKGYRFAGWKRESSSRGLIIGSQNKSNDVNPILDSADDRNDDRIIVYKAKWIDDQSLLE